MSKLRNNFAVFILSYGRPENIATLNTLLTHGYTGDYYIVDSDDDKLLDKYRSLYKSKLKVFNKLEQTKDFDIMDNRNEVSASIVFARNYCFKLAKELGIKYFLELDDDYNQFTYRYIDGYKLSSKRINNLNEVFEAMLTLLDDTQALTVSFSQGGDLMGGIDGSNFKKGLLRKAMNSFFCDVDRPFKFLGRINEDVNMYVDSGMRGKKVFQVTNIMLNQAATQTNDNGMTSLYLDYGTYLKSFYSVIIQPSAVKISKMGEKYIRIHHNVDWNAAAPKIINQKYKKGVAYG